MAYGTVVAFMSIPHSTFQVSCHTTHMEPQIMDPMQNQLLRQMLLRGKYIKCAAFSCRLEVFVVLGRGMSWHRKLDTVVADGRRNGHCFGLYVRQLGSHTLDAEDIS